MKLMFYLILILPAVMFSAVHAAEIFFLHCQYNLQGEAGSDIESADFNNDGIIDFIITSDSTWATGGCGWYEVFLGNGNGTFTRMGSQYIGESLEHYEWHILIGDFNEDLNEDCLIMNNEETTLYTGNGNGTFTEVLTYPWKVHNGCAVDFNCDGHLDVSGTNTSCFSSYPDSLKVLLGDGNGEFTLSWFYTNDYSFSSQSADFNIDGFPDLCVSIFYQFIVFFGIGDGNFGEPFYYNTCSEDVPQFSVCTDFNEDNYTDIAIVAENTGMSAPSTFVYINQQDETFVLSDELFPGACICRNIDAADIDLDTHIDLAVSGSLAGLTPGYGDGTFSHHYEDYLHYDLGIGFILSDLENDNDVDIVTIGMFHNECKIFLNTASQGCEEEILQPVFVPVISTWPNPFSNNVTIQFEGISDPSGLLYICDISGRIVKELQCAGEESMVTWDGRDAAGSELPSGLYVIRYNSAATSASSRLLKL